MAFKLSSPLAMSIGKPSNMVESNKPKPTVKKETPKDKIKAGRALKKEGRKEKRSERKDARLERRIVRATKKGKAALESGKVGKGSKSLEMRRKVDRLKAKKTKAVVKVKADKKTEPVKKTKKAGTTGDPVMDEYNSRKASDSALKKKGDPNPTPKPKAKMRTDAEIKKAYPGAVKVKGKINTYKYKGATLNPARFPVEKKGKTVKEAIKLKDKK